MRNIDGYEMSGSSHCLLIQASSGSVCNSQTRTHACAIGVAVVKGPTGMWRRGLTLNVHGSVMGGSGWCCEADHRDMLIEAPGNSEVSTLMADIIPGNEGGIKVSGGRCCVTRAWSRLLGELHGGSRSGRAFSRMARRSMGKW